MDFLLLPTSSYYLRTFFRLGGPTQENDISDDFLLVHREEK